jgi:hypothetical protein
MLADDPDFKEPVTENQKTPCVRIKVVKVQFFKTSIRSEQPKVEDYYFRLVHGGQNSYGLNPEEIYEVNTGEPIVFEFPLSPANCHKPFVYRFKGYRAIFTWQEHKIETEHWSNDF